MIQEESDRIVEENDGVCKIYSYKRFGNNKLFIVCAGTAVLTSAGNLRAKFIVHVVSPVWTGGEKRESEKLGDAVVNSYLNSSILFSYFLIG